MLEVIYDFKATNRREGGDMSCRGRSREAPGLHLERARDRVPGPGVVVDRFIEVIYTFTAVQNSQKRRKNGRFFWTPLGMNNEYFNPTYM